MHISRIRLSGLVIFTKILVSNCNCGKLALQGDIDFSFFLTLSHSVFVYVSVYE